MKIRNPLRFILLGACLIHSLAMAIDAQPANNADKLPNTEISLASKDDLNAQKELFQLQLDAKKELLLKDIEAQSKRIDAFEKRIDDQTNRISDIGTGIDKFGILITLLFFVAGFLGYRAAKNDARETARGVSEQTAEKWFETHHKDLISRMEELEVSVTQTIERIAGYVANVQQISSEAQEKMKATTEEFEARLQIEMQNIQTGLLESRDSGQSDNQPPKDNPAIEQKAEQLKQKPESEYTFTDWNTRAFAAYSEGKFEDAIFYWDKAIASPDIQPQNQAKTMFNKGVALEKLSRNEEAIAAYDETITEFCTAKELGIVAQVITAMVNKGILLSDLKRYEEAISVYDSIIKQFGTEEKLKVREQVVKAMVNKGFCLNQLNRADEAIRIYDAIVTQFGANDELTLREGVARAMVNKGSALDKLDRNKEALATFEEMIARFGAAVELNLREQLARAMVKKGLVLKKLNCSEDAILAYDAVITNFSAAEELSLRGQVANAMTCKGQAFDKLNRKEEEIAAYDGIISKFSTAKELALREQVVQAMFNKGAALSQQNRFDEAIAAYDAAIVQFGTAEELELRKRVASAMANKSAVLVNLRCYEEAVVVYDAVITQFGNLEEPSLQEQVANAWNGKGFTLLCMAKINWNNASLARELLVDASYACNQCLSRNSDHGLAHGNLAYITWLQGDSEAAEQHFIKGLSSAIDGGEELYKSTLADFEIHPIEPDQGLRELVETLWEEYRQSHSR